MNVDHPIKKKGGNALSKVDKRYNKKLSRERVVVEHTIGAMKKFRIMGNEFRNRIERYDDMTSIVSGLVNFHLMYEEGFNLTTFVS